MGHVRLRLSMNILELLLEGRCMQAMDLCDYTHHTYCMAQEKRKPTISLRLPSDLLRQVDELVGRTGMRSRTEFVERALVEYVEALKEAKVLRVRPYTRDEARAAILGYLEEHPGTYVSDLAEALTMDIELAFRVVNALAAESEVVA